jgi:hypothetical protein
MQEGAETWNPHHGSSANLSLISILSKEHMRSKIELPHSQTCTTTTTTTIGWHKMKEEIITCKEIVGQVEKPANLAHEIHCHLYSNIRFESMEIIQNTGWLPNTWGKAPTKDWIKMPIQ